MFHNRYDRVPRKVAARGAASRAARAGEVVETLNPTWEVADDDASRKPVTVEESGEEPWRFHEDSPWHVHTEFVFDGRHVHIDACGATRYGPGSAWREIRIYVDGELAGRGGACGCSLGGGGNDGPAVALLGDFVLEVDPTEHPGEPKRPRSVRIRRVETRRRAPSSRIRR